MKTCGSWGIWRPHQSCVKQFRFSNLADLRNPGRKSSGVFCGPGWRAVSLTASEYNLTIFPDSLSRFSFPILFPDSLSRFSLPMNILPMLLPLLPVATIFTPLAGWPAPGPGEARSCPGPSVPDRGILCHPELLKPHRQATSEQGRPQGLDRRKFWRAGAAHPAKCYPFVATSGTERNARLPEAEHQSNMAGDLSLHGNLFRSTFIPLRNGFWGCIGQPTVASLQQPTDSQHFPVLRDQCIPKNLVLYIRGFVANSCGVPLRFKHACATFSRGADRFRRSSCGDHIESPRLDSPR